MDHIYPKGENSFHRPVVDCECGPVVKWDKDICIHLPLTLNLYGISDNDDSNILSDAEESDSE